MKKIFTVALCAVLCLCVFVGCSKNGDDASSDKTTAQDDKTTVSQLATDTAKITGAEAIALLKSYSAKELGLDKVKEDYQFMLNTVGTEIDGEKYVRAEAGAMVPSGKGEDGNETYQMKTYKTFYISYDGKKLLVAQGDDKYKTIEIDKEHLAKVTTAAAKTETTKKK